jgi:putative Mn2+ efflux pump MntP
VWGVALAAVAVGLSNFAASIGIGMSGVDAKLRVRIGLIFGFFEAAMPLAGLVLGHGLAASLGAASASIGGGLLVLTGIWTVAQGRLTTSEAPSVASQPSRLVVAGAALSIDNLVIGFGLGAYKVPVVLAAVLIAAVSVAMSLVGLEVGNRLGASVERWSAEIGGIVLILVGVAIATHSSDVRTACDPQSSLSASAMISRGPEGQSRYRHVQLMKTRSRFRKPTK